MLKTNPRQRTVHKLFANLASSLFGSARPYSETKMSLTLLLGYFTSTSFSVQNPLYPVFLVLILPCLVFALLADTIIILRLKPLSYKVWVKFQAASLQNRYTIEVLDFVAFSSRFLKRNEYSQAFL